MTQEELLGQLRDIHLPAVTTSTPAAGVALWPLIVFTLVLCGVLVVRYWRHMAWRRQARAELRIIESDRDLGRRWSALVRLAAQIARISGRTGAVPKLAYKNPLGITDDDAMALGAHLRREITR